jgi:leucine dehydrogenase
MFDKIERARLNMLHFHQDPRSGLRAIIAIHNTRLGPALGGCRCIEYASEEAAIDDVIRLARGMSYKAALANVPQGGGKAVILQPAGLGEGDRNPLFRAFGRFVHQLGGQYITAVDSGTRLADMDSVAAVTPYVSGTSADGADPSPLTALGVLAGIRAAVQHRLLRKDLRGVRVAVQGLGNVGFALARMLRAEGAELVVCDIDLRRVQRAQRELGATVVSPSAIYDVDCEVFAPCGLGGIINQHTLTRLRCQIIAGAANNQLADAALGEQLHRSSILYAPDYVINAGGLIQVSLRYHHSDPAVIRRRVLAIGDTLADLFLRSQADNRAPEQIADCVAEYILFGHDEDNNTCKIKTAPLAAPGGQHVEYSGSG